VRRVFSPEWQDVHSGSTVPGGPIDFEATLVEEPRVFVLRIASSGRIGRRVGFVLAYELRRVDAGTRLVTRMRARIDLPGGRLLEQLVLAPGDGVMLRKQLRNIARLVIG